MNTYSNPRTSFQTDNWPYGRKRVTAVFTVEQSKRGERVSRVTQNPKGGWNKPKTTTYSRKQRIVDGSDGKTYIAELSMFGHVTIMQSNLKYEEETVHPSLGDRYDELMHLFA